MGDEHKEAVMAEARRWFVLLHDVEATDEDRAHHAAWLAASAENRAASDRANLLWKRLDAIVPVFKRRELAEEYGGGTITRIDTAKRSAEHDAGLSRRQWMTRAAAAVAVVSAGGYMVTHGEFFADHRTGTGERRSFALEDGSMVELGTGGALSLAFDGSARRVILHSGEAFFQVAPDRSRPFIVTAGGGETRALGTAFNVRHVGQDTVVTVTEHAVAVTAGSAAAVAVNEGEQLRYGPDGMGAIRTADLAAAMGWRKDRLVFRDTPLREVIAELQRYRRGRIVLTDAALGRMAVTGIFDTRDTDDALSTIQRVLPVRYAKITDLLVLIGPA